MDLSCTSRVRALTSILSYFFFDKWWHWPSEFWWPSKCLHWANGPGPFRPQTRSSFSSYAMTRHWESKRMVSFAAALTELESNKPLEETFPWLNSTRNDILCFLFNEFEVERNETKKFQLRKSSALLSWVVNAVRQVRAQFFDKLFRIKTCFLCSGRSIFFPFHFLRSDLLNHLARQGRERINWKYREFS